jgi:hypothetical protein
LKSIPFTQAIFEIAGIRPVHQITIVSKKQKDWWLNLWLDCIVQPQMSAFLHGHWWLLQHHFAQEIIQLSGRYALLPLRVHLTGIVEHIWHSLAG